MVRGHKNGVVILMRLAERWPRNGTSEYYKNAPRLSVEHS